MAFSDLLAALRSSRLGQLAVVLVAAAAAARLLRRRKPSARPAYLPPASADSIAALSDASIPFGILDVRRKAQLALGKAMDHGGDVRAAPQEGFDLDKTIFFSVESLPARVALKHRLGVELFWSDRAAEQVQRALDAADAAGGCPTCFRGEAKVPGEAKLPGIVLRPDQNVIDFMRDRCDFRMEHADGGFLDHLRFCFEYSQRHFRGPSPRVLLLHSIMGVGTNFFPMTVDKVPELKGLLTEDEYRHIEAFPSVLRLVNTKKLLEELQSRAADAGRLRSVRMHRVIDNAEITLTGEELWTHLNYQLVHLLDFLPAANWASQWDDNFLSAFADLLALLRTSGQLRAHVDADLTQAQAGPDGRPLSLAKVLDALVPGQVRRRLAVRQQARFSELIGHSLAYELEWGQ
ncbi:hypothetical protein DFJ74DRAFT_500606 [Hyaloraphidium curvatum]|nr:hypothetical protein DFJ74DRAFT_500606 [Hyaloraphidium curvatum]